MKRERRRKRESFTRTLSRIADKIERERRFRVVYVDDFVSTRCTSVFEVKGLWVAGSWARGALECGDLDLIVEIERVEGLEPPIEEVRRTLVGGAQDVQLIPGRPDRNWTGLDFSEAVLIYSSAEPDWRKAIESVEADPAAGRFARKLDALPLRPAQLSSRAVELERWIDLEKEGVVAWSWVDASELGSNRAGWSRASLELFGRLRWGKKRTAAAAQAARWLERQEVIGRWRVVTDGVLRRGGFEVWAGRPDVSELSLDALACSSVVVAPYRTRRGPNGLWVIRRGERHPLVEAFEGLELFCLASGNGPRVEEIDGLWGARGLALRLWSTFEAAESATGGNESVAAVGGRELLDLICRVEVVGVDDDLWAVNEQGWRFEDQAKPLGEEAAELLEALGPATRSAPGS